MMKLLLRRPLVERSFLAATSVVRIEPSAVLFRTFASKRKKIKKNPETPKQRNERLAFQNPKYTLTVSTGQTRKERINELREAAKEKILDFEELYRSKSQGRVKPDPPPDAAHHLLQFLDDKVPKDLESSRDHLQDFILNVFLEKYPGGARLRKLQRDIAFRMDTKTAVAKGEKLQYERILPIIGELERANKIKVRVGKQGRLILYKPTAAQLAVEVLHEKIDQVMTTHFDKEESTKKPSKKPKEAKEDEEPQDDEEAEDDEEQQDDEEPQDHSKKAKDDEEPLELSAKEYRRRYGREVDRVDWVEEFRKQVKVDKSLLDH